MARRNVPPLHVGEQALYWICELCTLACMMYSLFCASENAWRRNEPLKIEDGWSLLGRPMDTADFEWDYWSSYIWDILPWIIGHIVLSQTMQALACDTPKRHAVLTLYGLLAVSRLVGTLTGVFFCTQALILYIVSEFRSVSAVWVTSFAFLTLLNYVDEDSWTWLYHGKDSDLQTFQLWFYQFVFIWANICQRTTAFALERVWASRQQAEWSQVDTARVTESSKAEAIVVRKQEKHVGEFDKKHLVKSDGQDAYLEKTNPFKQKEPSTVSRRHIESYWVNPFSPTTHSTQLSGGCCWAEGVKPLVSKNANQTVENTAESQGVNIEDALTEVPRLLDMMHYMFYLPLFFTGPLLVYNKFHIQAHQSQRLGRRRLKDIVAKLLRVLFWAVFNIVWLHYFYAHAINQSSVVLEKQNRWTLAAVGYTLGQFFMTKYVVMFGLPAQIARLDGFEPPNVPACISYVYCYTDMWKSFDRGLYDFLKRYIFIPWGGSRVGVVRQIQASILCFVYIFYWHGAQYYLFLWCVINFLEAVSEQIGGYLENTDFVRCNIYSHLSQASVRRVRAVMAIPAFLMSVFAIFYFFGGTESGEIFLSKMLFHIPWNSLILFLLLVYCAIQNAMEVERLGYAKLRGTAPKQ